MCVKLHAAGERVLTGVLNLYEGVRQGGCVGGDGLRWLGGGDSGGGEGGAVWAAPLGFLPLLPLQRTRPPHRKWTSNMQQKSTNQNATQRMRNQNEKKNTDAGTEDEDDEDEDDNNRLIMMNWKKTAGEREGGKWGWTDERWMKRGFGCFCLSENLEDEFSCFRI